MSWVLANHSIITHMGLKISPKKANIQMGPELLDELDTIEMTHRLGVSQINAIFDSDVDNHLVQIHVTCYIGSGVWLG